MAEFALALPLLVMILFAILQFGIVFVTYLDVSAASREAARTASVTRTGGVAAALTAADEATAFTDDDDLGVVVSPATWSSGDEITVTVTYPYRLGIPGIAAQTGRLSSTVIARAE